MRLAKDEARRMIASVESEADEVRRGADQYAFDVFPGLENELTKLLATTRKGRATIDPILSVLVDSLRSAE